MTTRPANSATAMRCVVVDEADDLEQGVFTVGMQRQCTGTAGRVGNDQVAG